MHLKGKEKHFWRNRFNIGNLVDIPLEMAGFRGIDDETDDVFFIICDIQDPDYLSTLF